MLNSVYQLVSSRTIAIDLQNTPTDNRVLVRPTYMSICQADQRYFQGRRPRSVMAKKLPMALIHEAVGVVLADKTSNFKVGTPVALVPNVPGEPKQDIYPNYGFGFQFHSSGLDGFMQEIVAAKPEQLVPLTSSMPVTALTEMCSVAFHALNRFSNTAHSNRSRVAIWGDGSVGYILASVLKYTYPEMSISVVGKHRSKLSYFSFVQERYLCEELAENQLFDHVFECTGGEGAEFAIAQIIKHISPQGTIILMGVSENPVGILTRMVLEKGITLVGASRSNRADFMQAAKLFEDPSMCTQLSRIISLEKPVKTVEDIYERFNIDLANPFKTVFEWKV